MKGYPTWFSHSFLLIVFGATYIAGVFLIPNALEFRLEWENTWKLPAFLRVSMTAVHTLSSFFALVVLGSLLSVHVRQGWKKNKNRKSGGLLICFFLILTLSSIGILYSGNPQNTLIFSSAHIVLGILLPFGYIWHFISR